MILANSLGWASVRHALKKMAQGLARFTNPAGSNASFHLNPAVVPVRQRGPNGRELELLRTRSGSAISYRAGRSKYASKELKEACAQARLRARGFGPLATTAFQSV